MDIGLLHPIVVNQEGRLIAGQRRLEAYRSLGYNDIPVTVLDDIKTILNGEVQENTLRKDFTTMEQVEIKRVLEPQIKAEVQEKERLRKTGEDSGKLPESGDSREKVAEYLDVGYKTLEKKEKIVEAVEEGLIPETTLEKIDDKEDKTSVDQVYQKIIRDEKEAEYDKLRQKQLALIPKKEIKHTICGDFTTIETSDKIEDNSVDLIFTDPPYAEASLNLYKALGEFASKKLKEGGSLVAYAGHFLIDRIIEKIKQTPDLEFWWIIGEFHGTEGKHTRMRKQNITVSWKPLVWFVKRGREPTNIIRQKMFADSVESSPPENEKLGHEWEQSLTTPDYIITHLTDEKDFVVDPMCGSGTTLVSAIKLNRRCKGIDLEQKHLDESETRINQAKLMVVN